MNLLILSIYSLIDHKSYGPIITWWTKAITETHVSKNEFSFHTVSIGQTVPMIIQDIIAITSCIITTPTNPRTILNQMQ